MSDVVKQLRGLAHYDVLSAVADKAADEIERLMKSMAEKERSCEQLIDQRDALWEHVMHLRGTLRVLAGLSDDEGKTHGSELHDVGAMQGCAMMALQKALPSGRVKEAILIENAKVKRALGDICATVCLAAGGKCFCGNHKKGD